MAPLEEVWALCSRKKGERAPGDAVAESLAHVLRKIDSPFCAIIMTGQAARSAGALALLLALAPGAADGGPCFNQLQMLATHNSYHVAPSEAINALLESPLAQPLLPPELFLPQSWQYTHRPLTEQLQSGVRSLELDVHADPTGGRFAQSAGLRLAGRSGRLDAPELQEPGFKVYHLPDFDWNSTCLLLNTCLNEVRVWSEASPQHLPLVIFVEVKQPDDVAAALGPDAVAAVEALLAASPQPGPDSLAPSMALNASGFEALEYEISSVFGPGHILTPDAALALKLSETDTPYAGQVSPDALRAPPSSASCPWPALDSMRGKIMFVLIFGDEEQASAYEELRPAGTLGALFWRSRSAGLEVPGAVFYHAGASLGPEEAKAAGLAPGELPSNYSAYVEEWAEEAALAVEQGFIVRARVDQDTLEARHNSTARRDALLAAGAQLVATDYPFQPSQLFPSTYAVSIPGGRPARCVNGGSGAAGEVACA